MAYRKNYLSVIRITYLALASGLIQVYRDGLTSIVLFTFVNMMPIMVIAFLHYFEPKLRQRKAAALVPINSSLPRERFAQSGVWFRKSGLKNR